MRLRTQVLLVGLTTLAVPLLGWQSVRQLHASLQRARIDAQTIAVANLRATLSVTDTLDARLGVGALPAGANDWYAETARWPLFVDGYADDWQELSGGVFRAANGVGTDATLTLRAARRSARLFLLVKVGDPRVVHHVPPRLPVDAGENERPDPESLRVNGDALELFVRTPDGATTHALLSVIAPGPVSVVRALVRSTGRDRFTGQVPSTDSLEGWRAEWVDDAGGYQVEIELPLPPAGSTVGIAAIDVAASGGPRGAWVGSAAPTAMRSGVGVDGRLHHESPAMRETLLSRVPSGSRARLYDVRGRLLADANALYEPLPDGDDPPRSVAASLLDAILFRLFAWFAAGDLPLLPETEKTRQPLHLDAARRAAAHGGAPTSRYVTVDNDRVLGTLLALGDDASPRGYLLFESNEEHASRFTSSRLARLFALLIGTSLATVALLFAWAARVSFRIERLARDTARAVDADGRVGALPGSDARDEIGELSRDLAALLARSAAYARHLETLSARLSHELGTPLSVVRTSLENIDPARLDAESATLLRRADGGAERLGGIVRALIDSTRLERSVQHATFAPLELRAWLEDAAAEYERVYPGYRFRVVGRVRRAPLRASAALLRQALDKLVANARDFASGTRIELVLETTRGGEAPRVTLAVANRGPAIGASRRARLFEASYTSRAGEGVPEEADHAGLGLYVVRLVAEAHGGETFARDVEGGVVIGLVLPATASSVD